MRIQGVLSAAAVTVATAAVTLAQLNLPHGYWRDKDEALYVAVIVLAVAAAAYAIRQAVTSLQEDRVLLFERGVRARLLAALTQTTKILAVAPDTVGVHAFLRPHLPFRRSLIWIGGVRLGSRPSMNRPTWRLGKGVVGRGMELEKAVAENWHALFGKYEQDGPLAWQQLTATERYGLNWGELQLTADYIGIVAYPIFDADGSPIGVVSVDAPVEEVQLLSQPMKLALRDLSSSLALLGPPPLAWRFQSRKLGS